MDALSWGLDVSTSKAKTAAVALDWAIPGEARVIDVRHPLRAADIAPLIAENQESTWAVDVPFGWPDLFVALMADRHQGPLPVEAIPTLENWEQWRTRQVAQRLTDRFLTDDPRIKTRPLPASFQLLGATAAMWTLVEAQLASLGVPIDRAGLDGNVCETYPSAALAAWGFGKAKQTWSELQSNFPFLTADDHLVSGQEREVRLQLPKGSASPSRTPTRPGPLTGTFRKRARQGHSVDRDTEGCELALDQRPHRSSRSGQLEGQLVADESFDPGVDKIKKRSVSRWPTCWGPPAVPSFPRSGWPQQARVLGADRP